MASETTGEGSSDGDKAARRPLTEEEKLQQVKRSESVHQVTVFVIVTIGCCSKPELVWKFSVFYTCHTKVVILIYKKKFVRLEELMRVKQAERRQREQDEELEREKQRRKQGQELQQIRQKLQDDEMKKLADQRRREKMEDKLAR